MAGLFGGGGPSQPGGGFDWMAALQILGATLQDVNEATHGRQGGNVLRTQDRMKRLGDQKNYQDTLNAVIGTPQVNTVMSTPSVFDPARLPQVQAAKANDAQSMMFSGPLGQKLGPDTSSMLLPLLQNADPESGMSMMAKLALDTGKGTEYSTEPRFTQDGRAYLVGKDGTIKYLDGNVTPRERVDIAGNGVAYNPFATKPGTTFNDPNKAFGIGPDGQLAPNTPFQQYETNKALAGRPTTNIAVNTERTFAGNVAGNLANQFTANREKAQAAASGIQALQEARNLLDAGIYTGQLGELQLLGAKMGMGDTSKISNTEAFQAAMGRQTLALVKNLGAGAGISNADREYAEKVAGGKITLNKESLEKIIDINERAQRGVIKGYNSEAARVAKSPSMAGVPVDMMVPEPPAFSPQRPANSNSGIPTVNTPQEAARLPRGSKFRTPTGEIRMVP